MEQKRAPADFLKQAIGRPVVVKLNSGADYRGALRHVTREMQLLGVLPVPRESQLLTVPVVCMRRCARLPRRFHEHRDGADG